MANCPTDLLSEWLWLCTGTTDSEIGINWTFNVVHVDTALAFAYYYSHAAAQSQRHFFPSRRRKIASEYIAHGQVLALLLEYALESYSCAANMSSGTFITPSTMLQCRRPVLYTTAVRHNFTVVLTQFKTLRMTLTGANWFTWGERITAATQTVTQLRECLNEDWKTAVWHGLFIIFPECVSVFTWLNGRVIGQICVEGEEKKKEIYVSGLLFTPSSCSECRYQATSKTKKLSATVWYCLIESTFTICKHNYQLSKKKQTIKTHTHSFLDKKNNLTYTFSFFAIEQHFITLFLFTFPNCAIIWQIGSFDITFLVIFLFEFYKKKFQMCRIVNANCNSNIWNHGTNNFKQSIN